MIRILALDAPRLGKALRSGYFRRAGFRITTASDAREMLERAAILRPNVIIVVAGLLEPPGAQGLARQLRAYLADERSLVLLALPDEPMDVREDLRFYDGILALEEPELGLARALEPMTALPRRRQIRERVEIPAQLLGPDGAIDCITVDFSGAGAGLQLARAPAGDTQTIRFYRRDGRKVAVRANLAWIDAYSAQNLRAGVRFLDTTPETVRALYDLAFWEQRTDNGEAIIHLHGDLSERTALLPLLGRIERTPILDVSDIRRINMAGVLRWLDFFQKVPAHVTPRLRRMSIPMARQLLLVPAMASRCDIESYYASFECEECDVDGQLLVVRGRALVPPICLECGEGMLLAEPLLGLGSERGLG